MKYSTRIACLPILAATILVMAPSLQAGHSDEEVIMKTQTADYNIVTGNWDVQVEMSPEEVAEAFKEILPDIDFVMVDEEVDGENMEITFRGPGDEKLVLKLKPMGRETNIRLRSGLTGSESKSQQLFAYVYKRM